MSTTHLSSTLANPDGLHRYYKKIEPILKKPRMRASTSAVFSFLAISLFAWYAIRPTAQTIIHLRREIADKTTLNKQMEDKITTLIEVQEKYQAIQHRLPLLKQAIPENPDVTILVRQLQNIAVFSGASISSIQIPNIPILGQEATPGAKLAQQKPTESFPVMITLIGEYPALKSCIDQLLTLRRITSIDSISFKQGPAIAPYINNLQVSLKLTSYYMNQ